jgi:transcription elongation factor GreA
MNMAQSAKKFILTREGLLHLRKEYEDLVKIKRPQVTKRIQRAREFGDLSENSEYDAAKEEQSLLQVRIAQLEEILKRAQIIKPVERTDFIVIGSTILVEIDNQVESFTIVGTVEADPANKKISNESPVGAAMLGAKVGEVVEVVTPIVRAKYKILEIK